jgi:ABC-type multidrug transport system fused ATPase/permease subunit
MVRQVAEVENNMNAVERIFHYTNELKQEAPHEVEDSVAPSSWLFEGRIVVKDVFMKYRPELRPVLNGLSMDIASGEKVGICYSSKAILGPSIIHFLFLHSSSPLSSLR